ncbi:MAG: hypothetical protein ACI9NY_001411, partial [Kiritimatiellia bacterium]
PPAIADRALAITAMMNKSRDCVLSNDSMIGIGY